MGHRTAAVTLPPSSRHQRIWQGAAWWALSGFILIAGLWYFYRGFFRSGLNLTQGDSGDGRLTEVIAGHWRAPFQFGGGLTDTGIFFPFGQGLMYSDTHMAFGLLTIPSVGLGLNPSVAFQWSLMVTSAIGYVSCLALLRIGPRAPWPIAITASFVATFSNGLVVASNHPQLLALSLVPASALALLLALRTSRITSRVVLGMSSGAIFGLTTYSTFAIGWFTIVGGLIALAFWVAIARSRFPIRRLVGHRVEIPLSTFAGALPFVALFTITYVPLLTSGARRSLDEIRFYALAPQDLFAVSPTNVVWFKPLYALFDGMSDTERAMAPTPLLVLTSLVLLSAGVASARRSTNWMAAGTSAIASGLILWLSPVAWGSFFPWKYVLLIPGADAIRAIGRIELMAGLLITMGSAIVATQLMKGARVGRLATTGGMFLLLLISLEQANFLVQQQVDVQSVQRTRAIPPPPGDCRSFALIPPLTGPRPEDGQIDAAIIAQTTGIPTWNGGSGGIPPGWNLSMNVSDREYAGRLVAYARQKNLSNFCVLSLQDENWIHVRDSSDLAQILKP